MDISDALKLMSEAKDVIQDTHGNVSCIEHNECLKYNTIYIKPSGIPYDKITDVSICHMFEVGFELVNPSIKPSVDLCHHINLYRYNPKIKAICHTHSPYVVAHAILEKPIVCCTTEQADYFGGDIKCMPYSDLNNWSQDIIKEEYGLYELALLLGHHGALTFSKKSAVDAVKLAIELENVARKNAIAKSMSNFDLCPLHLNEIEKWRYRYENEYGQ